MNREKFTRCWLENEPDLLSRAFKYTQSSQIAREIVQDIAVLALKDLPRFDTAEHFRRWAFLKLRWLVLDAFKDRKLVFKSLEYLSKKDKHASLPTQENNLILNEILKLIGMLPRNQQIVLQGMIKGQSTEMLAQNLGIEESSVRSLRRFARKRLTELLEKEERG